MVPIRYGQPFLRKIRFFPLLVRSYPNVRDCKVYNQPYQHKKQGKSTGKHGYNGQDFITTIELGADNEHL